MLGHLVLGRYGSGSETRVSETHQTGWMTRALRALWRRRS